MAPYEMLIFDLDDTLLDTSGQLVAPAAREACQAMVEAGLQAEVQHCLIQRAQFFQNHPRANIYDMLVDHFGVHSGSDRETVSKAGLRAFFDRKVETHIQVFTGVNELLQEVGRRFRLRLVTSGVPATQRQKVEILELKPHFEEIHLVDRPSGQTKHQVFQQILHGTAILPAHILCIGDRPDREIREAKALGMATCRIRYGEFSHLDPSGPEEEADHTLNHVLEIREVLQSRTHTAT